MRVFKLLAVLVLLALPVLVQADAASIPGSSTWYFHADFVAMRNGKAGKSLYDWLDGEVFSELRDELGVDFDKEAERLTAFSAGDQGPVVILEGPISQGTKDRIMALAAGSGELQQFKSGGKVYFYLDGDADVGSGGDIDIDIESLEDEAYVSLALRDRIVVTHTKKQMELLLANDGKLPQVDKRDDALFILRADRSLVQAGVNAEQLQADEGDAWESNILRNTKHIAILLADLGDQLGFEAQLMTTEPDMAESLASIVRGLISLQAFNDEMDPDVALVLKSTQVDVKDGTLKIALALDPDTVVASLED